MLLQLQIKLTEIDDFTMTFFLSVFHMDVLWVDNLLSLCVINIHRFVLDFKTLLEANLMRYSLGL
jgi:hypothetical protein